MSISDRLDQRMDEMEDLLPYSDPRPAIDALRAVLDVCDETTLQCSPHSGSAPYMVVSANSVRATIAAVLGEEA